MSPSQFYLFVSPLCLVKPPASLSFLLILSSFFLSPAASYPDNITVHHHPHQHLSSQSSSSTLKLSCIDVEHRSVVEFVCQLVVDHVHRDFSRELVHRRNRSHRSSSTFVSVVKSSPAAACWGLTQPHRGSSLVFVIVVGCSLDFLQSL